MKMCPFLVTKATDWTWGANCCQMPYLAAPAQAATAVNTPISVASAINIPTDFGHHGWVVDIQPQADAPHR
jgi:hypothetical protein